VDKQSDHPSETEALNYPHFNKVIENAGTIADLTKIVARAYYDFEQARKTAPKPSPNDELRSNPLNNHNPLAPRRGDGSITSVNVPKRRG